MIEIELKYRLKGFPKADFPLISESEEEDIYYDTNNYDLLRNGNFLRIRNQKRIDFKLNTNDLSHLYCKEVNFSFEPFPYEKIEEVLHNLGIDISFNSYEEFTKKLDVLSPIIKKRKSYKIDDNITMVLDEIDNLGYFLEIEYDVQKDECNEEEVKRYEELLKNTLKDNNLLTEYDEQVKIGYVELYLKKHNIDAYHLGIYQDD